MIVGDRVYFKDFDKDDIRAYGICEALVNDDECLIHFDDGEIHLCDIASFEIVDKDVRGKVNKKDEDFSESVNEDISFTTDIFPERNIFKTTRIKGKSPYVTKYIMESRDDIECPIMVESVLYEYEDRTVICCSTQSGCKVGCRFCGTGSKFIRNLSKEEILEQIKVVLGDISNRIDIMVFLSKINNKKSRFQIMFMSMGEPFHNFKNLEDSINELAIFLPNAELLVSTIGIKDDEYEYNDWIRFLAMSIAIDKIGLQFSIHKSTDEERDKLIPYKDKLTLKEIARRGKQWVIKTARPVYLNYCIDDTNNTDEDAKRLRDLFEPTFFHFTFSVICNCNETMKDAGFKNLDKIREFEKKFKSYGYETSVFNPDGQDDIGGGCGQLWQFQKFASERGKKMTKIISAFPACGKTYFFTNKQNIFTSLDSDSSEFSWVKDKNGNNTKERNPKFPENYIEHIKNNLGKVDIIFVSSHDVVREALKQNGLGYTLIYPDKSQKQEWMRRFRDRGDKESFINFISTNWDNFIDSMYKETYPEKIKLSWGYEKYIDTDLLLHLIDLSES